MLPLALILIGLLGWLVLRTALLVLVGRWRPPATGAAGSMLHRRYYFSRSRASTLVELASHLMLSTSILIAMGVVGIKLLDSQERTVALLALLHRLTAMGNAHLPVVIFVCAGMAAATVALYVALTRSHVLAKFARLKSEVRPTEEMRPLLDELRDKLRARESMRTMLNKGPRRTLTLLRINHQLARVTRKLNQKDLERRSEQLRLDPKSITGAAGLRWLTGQRRTLGFAACLLLAASCTSLAITVSPSTLFLLIEKKDLSIAESRARAEWGTLKESLQLQPVESEQTRDDASSLVATSFERSILSLFPDGSQMSALVVRRQLLGLSPTTIQTAISRTLEQDDPVTQAALAYWPADELPLPHHPRRSAAIPTIGVAQGPARDPEDDPILRAALDVVVLSYLAALANGASPSDAFETAAKRAPATFFRDWDSGFLRPDLEEDPYYEDPYYEVFPGGCATDFRYSDERHCPPYYSNDSSKPLGPDAVRPEDRGRPNGSGDSRHQRPPRTGAPGGGHPVHPRPSGASGGDSAYGRLDSYQLVGGVLIGRRPKPTTDKAVTIVDLLWRDYGDTQIELTVKLEDGKSHSAAFNHRLVYQALQYAAENRPVAVTILPTSSVKENDPYVERMVDFLSRKLSIKLQTSLVKENDPYVERMVNFLYRKLSIMPVPGREKDFLNSLTDDTWIYLLTHDMWIYLHPVLRNTPLGCKFIKLDQLVDESESGKELKEKFDLNNVVSQVRESPYELTSILDDAFSPSDREFPLYFTIYHQPESVDDGDKKTVLVEIPKADKVKPMNASIVKDMDDSLKGEIAKFVYLQRFFRGVLMRYFGDTFPLSRLPDLQREVMGRWKDKIVTERRFGEVESELDYIGFKEILDDFENSEFANDVPNDVQGCVG